MCSVAKWSKINNFPDTLRLFIEEDPTIKTKVKRTIESVIKTDSFNAEFGERIASTYPYMRGTYLSQCMAYPTGFLLSPLFSKPMQMLPYSFTKRKRHLKEPDAVTVSLTGNSTAGVNIGMEKGLLIILRGEDIGYYNINGVEVGVGFILSVGGNAKITELYSSSKEVIFKDFYGEYDELNATASAVVNLGGSLVVSKHAHDAGYTYGMGFSMGLDFIPLPFSVSRNKGTATRKISDLSKETKKISKKYKRR